jgi:hypothetical protein
MEDKWSDICTEIIGTNERKGIILTHLSLVTLILSITLRISE